MTILTIVLIVLAAIIVMVLILAATMPATYSIKREVIINRPQADVFNYIKNLRHMDQYSVWAMRDPSQRITTTGIDGNVDFVYAWESDDKKVGQGRQTITAITSDTISSRVKSIKPFEGQIDGDMSALPVSDNTTKVIWNIGGDRSFGMRIFHLLFRLPDALGKDMAQSLDNLKRLLEK